MLALVLFWLLALMLYYRYVGNPQVLHDGFYALAPSPVSSLAGSA